MAIPVECETAPDGATGVVLYNPVPDGRASLYYSSDSREPARMLRSGLDGRGLGRPGARMYRRQVPSDATGDRLLADACRSGVGTDDGKLQLWLATAGVAETDPCRRWQHRSDLILTVRRVFVAA